MKVKVIELLSPAIGWNIAGQGSIEAADNICELFERAIKQAKKWDRDTDTKHLHSSFYAKDLA